MALFLFFNTQNKHIKSTKHNSIAMFSLKNEYLAGFKPGSFVPEGDALSTAPRRQGIAFKVP
jgi:hypothetical protein